MFAIIGRIVVWCGAVVAMGYGLVGAYIVVRLYLVYCGCIDGGGF